jgi:hypothetical protein
VTVGRSSKIENLEARAALHTIEKYPRLGHMSGRFLLAILFMAAASGAQGALEFSGYFGAANEIRFQISDPDAGQSSHWLRIGDSFRGYVVKSFSPTDEILTVARAESVVRLPLKRARVKTASATDDAAKPGPGGELRPIPQYTYNAERGAYEVTGFKMVPVEEEAKAKLESANARLQKLRDEKPAALKRKKELDEAARSTP